MSALTGTTTTDSIELTTDADTATLVDAVESLVESNQQLAERVAQLEERISEQDAEIESLEADLEQTREELAETTERLRDEVEETSDDLRTTREEVEATREQLGETSDHLAKEQAQIRGRITDLESGDAPIRNTKSRLEEVEETVETPMGRVVACSEELAAEELSANQQRARWIARDILDHASRAPAGHVITSNDIRMALAGMGENTHDQTIDRVIRFLDNFGKEDVTVVKRRGLRRISFTEELVERLSEVQDAAITSCVMAQRLPT